jgi:hypothetical protein
MRDAWFSVGLADEAAFFQVISNSALHLQSIKNKRHHPKDNSESMHYHTLALKSVYSRIGAGEPSTTDGMIGAISGFMAYSVSKLFIPGIQASTLLRRFRIYWAPGMPG